MLRSAIPMLVLALLLTVVLGVGPASADEDDSQSRVSAVAKAMSDVKVSLEDAIATAAKKTEGTALVSDLEVEDGTPVFEVIVYVGGENPHFVEVEIDAVTGKVLETEILGEEDDDADDEDADDDDEADEEEGDDDDDLDGAQERIAAVLPNLKIALAEAVGIAAKKAEGAACLSRFEDDDGVPTFEVFVLVAGEKPRLVDVDIDARTGKVLEMETVGAGEDGDEDGDDE